MLCCVIAGGIVAFLYRLQARVTGRGTIEEATFAPPARWSGPLVDGRAAHDPAGSRNHEARAWLPLLMFGLATYPALSALFELMDALPFEPSGADRLVLLVISAGAAAVFAMSWQRARYLAQSKLHSVGAAASVTGVAWFVMGILDMHAVSSLPFGSHHTGPETSDHVDSAGLGSDLAFHTIGPAVTLVGLVLLVAHQLLRRDPPPSLISIAKA